MLKRPFIMRHFTLVSGDEPRTNIVSLVIRVLNDVTENIITAGITVSIKGKKDLVPILNRSGYFCFTDLKADVYTIEVKPVRLSADIYFDAEDKVTLAENDSDDWKRKPVKELRLIPKPSFPFPANATLIRGIVREKTEDYKDKKYIVNADVQGQYVDTENRIYSKTDHNGEFVLQIKDIRMVRDKKHLKNMRIIIKKENNEKSFIVNDWLLYIRLRKLVKDMLSELEDDRLRELINKRLIELEDHRLSGLIELNDDRLRELVNDMLSELEDERLSEQIIERLNEFERPLLKEGETASLGIIDFPAN